MFLKRYKISYKLTSAHTRWMSNLFIIIIRVSFFFSQNKTKIKFNSHIIRLIRDKEQQQQQLQKSRYKRNTHFEKCARLEAVNYLLLNSINAPLTVSGFHYKFFLFLMLLLLNVLCFRIYVIHIGDNWSGLELTSTLLYIRRHCFIK